MSRLTEEQQKKIREIFKQTGSIRQTSKQTKHSRKAVRKALGVIKSIPNAPQIAPRKSKLDPYKAKINHLVKEKKLSAVRVLDDIRELGYPGGYSILKEYIRRIRPKTAKIPRPPIDHPPGEEGQMDWSPHKVTMGGKEVVVHTGSIVLCYSRYIVIHHFTDETLSSVIRLHEKAFAEVGAVPEKITYDNMTTVGRHIGPGKVWINPTFNRFAEGYGFEVVILQPGNKERHGKVERPFRYIEDNFLNGREFADLEDLNNRADYWRAHTANVRNHGTTRERPVDRLAREKSLLKPLPWDKSDKFYKEVERLVQVDFCVAVDKRKYSVNPDLIGQYVKVRLFLDHLEIWTDEKMDCHHVYAEDEHSRQVLPEHEKIYKTITGQRQLLKEAFLRLGKAAEDYYEGLKKTRKSAAGYHLQRILKYADRHGADVVSGALAHAARYDAYSANSVLRIIQGRKIKSSSKRHNYKPIPDNVRDWLRTCDVEEDKPGHFDQLINKKNHSPDKDGEDE